MDLPAPDTGSSSPGMHSPAVPAYVLRGHTSPIHALRFLQQNAYLASGDSDGWIVVWSVASRRAAAVWRAHEGSILGVREWDGERLVTHGRDHRLRIWQLGKLELETLDTRLPVEGQDGDSRKEPWLLHSISINALNFCAFAMCYDPDTRLEISSISASGAQLSVSNETLDTNPPLQPESANWPVIIAVSNALDSGAVDFYHLPSEHRVSTLPADRDVKTGMVMALSLSQRSLERLLKVVSGYESGHVMVHIQQTSHVSDQPWSWKKVLVGQPHSQPLLSLDVSPAQDFVFTSSADAIIAKFAIPSDFSTSKVVEKPQKILNTKHAGQQGLSIRTDGKIFATAGWDGRIRVYSAKAMRELAVLKWHKEGCYAVCFATIDLEQVRESLGSGSSDRELVPERRSSALEAIKDQRNARAQNTHWLAAGGKDGKISLWDIY